MSIPSPSSGPPPPPLRTERLSAVSAKPFLDAEDDGRRRFGMHLDLDWGDVLGQAGRQAAGR